MRLQCMPAMFQGQFGACTCHWQGVELVKPCCCYRSPQMTTFTTLLLSHLLVCVCVQICLITYVNFIIMLLILCDYQICCGRTKTRRSSLGRFYLLNNEILASDYEKWLLREALYTTPHCTIRKNKRHNRKWAAPCITMRSCSHCIIIVVNEK